MGRAKENLGGTVPESNDLVSVALERDGEGAAEAEISDLKNTLVLVKEKVLRLEIAVEDTVAVAVSHALAELEEEALDEGRREGPGIGALAVGIDELLEIGVEILENKVKDGLGEGVGGGFLGLGDLVDVFDGEEADDVDGLGEKLKERHLA